MSDRRNLYQTAHSLGLLLVQLGRGVIPNLLPEIIASLSITPFLAGIALSVLTGLCALIFVEAIPLMLASIILFSAGMTSYTPVMQAYLMDRFPDSRMGGDFGAVKTIYTTLGSVGPLYLGYMASTAGYPVAFGSLVDTLLASAAISGLVLRSE